MKYEKENNSKESYKEFQHALVAYAHLKIAVEHRLKKLFPIKEEI